MFKPDEFRRLMSVSSGAAGDSAFEPLLNIATMQLYRRNSFRVLSLPLHVTAREAARRQARRNMERKLGVTSPATAINALSIQPAPTEEEIRLATERLGRPLHRLLDEIFWFWPDARHQTSDTALEAIERGDVDAAEAIWRERAADEQHGQIAAHNLAILAHLLALDKEAVEGVGGREAAVARKKVPWLRGVFSGRKLELEEQQRVDAPWLEVFRLWQRVIDGSEFWAGIADRITNLKEAQLSSDLPHKIRQSLPTAILLIQARCAYACAERGDAARAKAHVRLVQKAPFGSPAAEDAFRVASKPLLVRMRAAIDEAKAGWKKDAPHANAIVRQLHDQGKALLAISDAALPFDHPVQAGLKDLLASALMEGAVAFALKTNDWGEFRELLGLSEQLAVGTEVKAKIAENRQAAEENKERGNDWYSAGYWQLPEETVADLESARERMRVGDLAGAIARLVVLDPKTGPPPKRCLAYCLNMAGVDAFSQALAGFDRDTSVLRAIMASLKSSANANAILSRRPDPNLPAWRQPPCLNCKQTGYSRWYLLTHQNVQLFMCSDCHALHEAELAPRKAALAGRIRGALQQLLLAQELEPKSAFIQRNVIAVREENYRLGSNDPAVKELKKELSAHRQRATRLKVEPHAAESTCHFCGERPGDSKHQISVSMCGDARSAEMMFHKGVEFRLGDIVVPRCQECAREHMELPQRVERWRAARAAAGDDEHMAEVAATLRLARDSHEQTLAKVAAARAKLASAQADLKKAKAFGAKCERCSGHEKEWRGYICQHCDKEVLRLSNGIKAVVGGVVGATALAMLHLQHNYQVFSRVADWAADHWSWAAQHADHTGLLIAAAGIPVFVGLGMIYSFKRQQWRHRRQLSSRRRAESEAMRQLWIPPAMEELDKCLAELKSVERTVPERAVAYEEANRSYEAARREALAVYDISHPAPTLRAGIKEEREFLTYGPIVDLRGKGWGFGHKLGSDLKPGPYREDCVRGLVAPRTAGANA